MPAFIDLKSEPGVTALTFLAPAELNALLADAARRFVNAELQLDNAAGRYDPGTLTACLAARHDMQLLVGVSCGCDEGTCPGVIG